jgi:hypothetical protein
MITTNRIPPRIPRPIEKELVVSGRDISLFPLYRKKGIKGSTLCPRKPSNSLDVVGMSGDVARFYKDRAKTFKTDEKRFDYDEDGHMVERTKNEEGQ